MIDITQNGAAFLAMLRHSEGTDKSPDPYRVCYGYHHTIVDLSDHPACTGEWLGERITIGTFTGMISTAAGAYQITRPTWVGWRNILGLPDFTAPSQDQAALAIIDNKGALALINAGQVAEAIPLLHQVWASLPGGDSGQPEATMATLIQSYTESGGAFA
jgi:lysozyme